MSNILIAQLSDIHAKEPTSIGLTRLEALAGAIGSLRDESDCLVLLLTGDIAFSGRAEEYDLVKQQLEGISRRLKAEWKFSEVRILACPGNHDCDFTSQKPVVRDAILASVSSEGSNQLDLVRELAEVQANFYAFRNDIGATDKLSSEVATHEELNIAGRKLNIITLNTSWSSKKHEDPGSLRMPSSVLPSFSISDDLTIALLHHPLNWYVPQDGKALSDWLDLNVDLAMWGHEHREDTFKVIRRRYGSSVQHFISRPLEDPSVECGIRVLSLAPDNSVTEYSFRWRSGRFEGESPKSSILKQNPARQLGRIRLSAGFKNFLSDSGGSFKHPRLERALMLQDIFIEPYFKSYSSDVTDSEKLEGTLSLEAMTDALALEETAIVFGPEQAGKTTFAKYLVEDARHRGISCLYFDGAKLRTSNRGEVTAWKNAALAFQYEPDCIQLVEQLPPSERIVIVDNIHELPGSASAVREILQRLAVLGGRAIFLSAQNPAVTILAASHSSSDELKLWSDAKWFEIMPLNNRTRGHLIRRWVATGRDEVADSGVIESEVRRIKLQFDSTLGNGLAVKYPFFLLAILQQIDAGVDANTIVRNGSHGHIFEAMVTSAIDTHVSSHDVGTAHDFLAALALQLWSAESACVSENGFEALISEFRRERFIQLSHPALMNELISSKVLSNSPAGLSFRYSYFYYYYLARWLAQRAGTSEGDDLLRNFVENIHTELAANVVTFVAHMGHEKWVLSLLLPAAEELFSGAAECKLSDHANLAAKYSGQYGSVVLLGEDNAQVSDHHHDIQDESQGQLKDAEESLEDPFKYQTAIRCIQVLGQVMRSRAGSITAADKLKTTEISISLARRLMTVLYSAAELSAEIIVEHASELFDTKIESGSHEAHGLASRLIAAVVGGISKGLVSRAAEVFATKDLAPLIEALEDDARSVGDLDKELIVLCARIIAEQRYPSELVESLLKRIPKNDVLSKAALAHSVARTFYLQPPARAVRDAACAKLGIQVRQLPLHRSHPTNGFGSR